MSQRVTLSFALGDYSSYGTTPVAVSLSPRQCAILASVAALLDERQAWENMSDVQWDTTQDEIADINEVLQTP